MGSSWTPPGWYWAPDTRFKWRQEFTWMPKRSEQSGERIWLTKAWYGWRWIDGPAGESPVKVEKWLTEEEYMWQCLSGQ